MQTIETTQFEQSDALRWVTAHADHVAKRFGSRAVVSVRQADGTFRLSQIYAMESGGLVLVEHGDHHKHGDDDHDEHEHEDEHEQDYECPREFWVASPEQVVLEMCPAQDGELCTGFGYLGLSRTPHVFVA